MSNLFQAIDSALEVEDWLIALDRDGTLVPYANRPEEALVTDQLRRLLADLCARQGFNVAIISARSGAQLTGDFAGIGAVLGGNYGMEVLLADGTECIQPQALNSVPMLKEARDQLCELSKFAEGTILEDHGYSICLHWHNVHFSQRDELHHAVVGAAGRFPLLKFRRLPTSYEVLPNIRWDKGLGLAFVDSTLHPDQSRPRTLFFAGDTAADTPAFEYVNERGGISVRVGGNDDYQRARFLVSQPDDLHKVLEYICKRRHAVQLR